MYNGYPQNKNKFLNKPRNETCPQRPKYEGCKILIMHKEETDIRNIMYRDNFLSEIGHNCGTHSTHQNKNKSFKIFKLFKINNVPTTAEEMAEYAYSTIDVDEVVKNKFKISNNTLVMNIQNLNKSSERLLDINFSNVNNITDSEILNYYDSSFTDVDNSLICIAKQVCKNIEAAKVEFDTFLHRDKSTKNTKLPYKTNKLSENSTVIKVGTSQENFVLSQDSTEMQNCDVMEIPDEKISTVCPPEINECSNKTNIQPLYTNKPSFIINVYKISDVPVNYNTKHDLHELKSKF